MPFALLCRRIFIAGALLIAAVTEGKTRVALSPDEISELAARANARLATYGGLSREAIDYVITRANELGSVQAARSAFSSVEQIHLSQVHRMKSDLDIMIIPNEGAVLRSEERQQQLRRLTAEINLKFPPDIFHSKMDTTISTEFFKRYRPARSTSRPFRISRSLIGGSNTCRSCLSFANRSR
ncbi:MAG: hypothetical protein NDJ89_03865 [Oligoflexia bacterium]|nr:hypothetical protein [Oligoflexia bacterium]